MLIRVPLSWRVLIAHMIAAYVCMGALLMLEPAARGTVSPAFLVAAPVSVVFLLATDGGGVWLLIYLGTFVFCLTGAELVIWRSEQRRLKRWREGLCVKCGYDLRASGDRCPECGTRVRESWKGWDDE